MSGCIPILQKYEALLARAVGSDSVEERRTCSTIIVKLIDEGKLFVVAEPPRQVPPPPPPYWQAPRKPDYRTSDAPKPRTIATKFDCTCLDCGSDIYIGDRCVWLKGKGCWHVECAP